MCTSQPQAIELSLPSVLGIEKIARDTLAAYARSHGFGRERVEDLQTALCEACINAIEHGNRQSPELRVNVSCCYHDDQLLVEVCDAGMPDAELPNALPLPAARLRGQCPRRGMGLMIIGQIVDDLGFSRCNHGGNRFWFAIRRMRGSHS